MAVEISTSGVQPLDFNGLFAGELLQGMVGALDVGPSLIPHIVNIVLLGSQEQVVGADAPGDIAVV